MMLEYKEFAPDKQLLDYVDSYWLTTGFIDADAMQYGILPDCCCDILINLGDSVISSNTSDTIQKHKAYIIGSATKFTQVSLQKGLTSICGIRFKPLGFIPFLQKTELGDFKNNSIDFDLVAKASFDAIFENNETQHTPLAHQLDKFLLQLFRPDNYNHNIVKVVKAATHIINQKRGIIKMNELSDLVNTSPRNLERLFYKNIGLTPKEFSQITKLQNIRKELLINDTKSIGQIAFEYNYYDNAHFTKDFINHTGTAPSKYR
jgi:AraC-like DNA-binding protein